MIWALLGMATVIAGLAVAAVLGWRKVSAAKDDNIKLKGINAEQKVEASQIQARLIVERDSALQRAGTLAAEVADRDVKIAQLEHQLADVSAKLARAVVARVKAQPPSEDGAAAVNDLLADPLPGKEPTKP